MSSQMLPTGNRTLINQLTVNNVQNTFQTSSFRLLYDHICVAAFDNSDQVDQMKCYPGTRSLLLERLEHWLSVPGNARRLLTWLDGPMGSGKTAVARTMAERVSANNKLVGAFIFRRGQPGRSDATRFVATLAYQLALSIPLVRPHIEEQLNHDPSVLQQSLSRQLDALILEPLRKMRSQNPDTDVATLPNLIIVDGLDECGADQESGKEEMQTRVLDLLHRLALSQDVLPFAVLIHSRPEKNIKNWFSLESHEEMTNRLTLDSSYKPEDDIRFFVTQSFLAILDDHPSRDLLPPGWPYNLTNSYGDPVHAIETLVRRSSGQFIYAAVAMKFIASQHCRPDKRLLSVLSSNDHHSPDAPNAIIDSLYAQVLNSTNDHETVKQILAFQNIAYRKYIYQSIPLTSILSMLSISIQDFHHSLQQLESLLTLEKPFLKFHHSSFGEFLESPNRSAGWFTDDNHYRWHFSLRVLRLFRDETYVGAQISFLRLVGQLLIFNFHNASTVVHQEVEHFCDFPNSSYGASVERFLSQVPLSTFIWLTRGITALRGSYSAYYSLPGRTLLRHLAALIQPNIQPHLKDPDSFARFLCWATYVPGSRLSTQGHDYASSNHRWPRDLRHIMLVMTVLPSEFLISPFFSHEDFCTLFSIPSTSFLNSALLIVLKALELGLRHSRRQV
ncbi:hypothetical protein BJ165DRAFT_1533314 [Panaeolus papilionaceus]|nr:hypothetical protein BJ165DRAFT_1533314 [Panaeolus papilionaceus]